MKKIVGMIAAAAIATSVFAADISAKVQLEGNLFKFNTDKSMSLFDIDKPSDQHWNPVFNLSTSSDTAGAEFVVYTGKLDSNGNWNKAFNNGANRFKIWMSPVDGLKLIFGLNGFKLNEEHIRWSKSDSGAEDYGYSLQYAKDGLTIDLGLLPGWASNWLSKADGGDLVLGLTAAKVAYSADFGTISGLITYKSIPAVAAQAAKAGEYYLDPATGTIKQKEGTAAVEAKDASAEIKFGVGYANNFDGTDVFVNVLGYMADNKFNKIRGEIYASGSADKFGWSIFPVVEIYPEADDKVELFLLAKATYKLDPATVYFEFADLQGLINKFGKNGGEWDGDNGALFTLGLNGNLGGASWDVGARINLREKVAFSVPVTFSFGW